MKRSIVISILILAVVSLACNLGGLMNGAATETPEPPPQMPSATSTARPLSVEPSPTREIIATLTPSEEPTRQPVESTEEPQETQTSTDYFRDDFDSDSGLWEYLYITGNSREQCSVPSLLDGAVEWACPPGEETQLRFYTLDYDYEDVVVQAEVENFGSNKNGISLLCRVSDLGWYEFRISSGGEYYIFRFDWMLRNSGQNPYIFIANGATPLILVGQKVNTFAMDCSDSDFKFYINSSQMAVTIPDAKKNEFAVYPGGGVGFGVMLYGDTPATTDVAFNWFETLSP
jgi:hypothetical protein